MIKNTGSQRVGVQMVSASDGSAFTGSVTVAVTVDAGTQATGSVGSGACAHEGGGYHTYAPSQAETNGDLVAFTFSGSGAVPQTVQVYTRASVPDVNVTTIEGTDATNQIRDAIVDDATRIDASALNTLSSHDPGEVIMGATDLGTGAGLTTLATQASVDAIPTAGENADQVWEENITDHWSTADSTAEVLSSIMGVNNGVSDLSGNVNTLLNIARMAAGDVGSTGNTTTTVQLDVVTYGDDELIDYLIVVFDSNASALHTRWITDYVASTNLATLHEALPFTPGTGDTYSILPMRQDVTGGSGASVADIWNATLATYEGTVGSVAEALADAGDSGASASDIADAVLDEAMAGHTTAGTLGKAIADVLEDTATTIPGTLTTIDGIVDDILADTADMQPKLGSPAASVSADIAAVKAQTAAIEADTQDLQAQVGTDGAGLTALPWNASWDAEVQSEAADAITAAGLATASALTTVSGKIDTVDDLLDTEIAALTTELAKVPKSDGTATWNATALAAIQTEANDALVANHLDHLLAATYDPASKPGAADALLNELVESDAGVSRFTANALEESPTGGSAPTAGEIADAVWEEDITDHYNTADSTAEVLSSITGVNNAVSGVGEEVTKLLNIARMADGDVGSTGNTTTTVQLDVVTYGDDELIDYLIIILDTSASAFHARWITDYVASTNLATLHEALPFTPGTGDTYSVLPIRQDVTGGSGLDAAGVRTAIGLATANLDTQLSTIDSNVDDILTDTGTTLPATLSTISGKIDTVDDLLDSEMPAATVSLAAIKAKTDNLPSDPADASDISALIGALPTASETATEILGATVESGFTVEEMLRLIGAAVGGKVSGAETTTITFRNVGDTKDVIIATVDGDGNRSAITLDVS